MTTVTRNQKIYFAAVGALALWVAFWGLLIPEHVDKAIPWLVPPLHSRFIGAIYLSAIVLMGGSMRVRYFAEVKIATFIVAMWTGMLFVISLFYLSEFNFSRGPVWFWFGAYILYPIIGFWFAWIHRNTRDESTSPSLPNWIRSYFLAQGVIVTILALALLFAPEFMVNIWPWKVTRMLIQIYSGPFLAYGLGSLMLSRQRTWLEVRIVAMASLILAVGVLVASFIHRALFTASNMSTWIWFGGFLLAALLLGVLIITGRNYTGDSKMMKSPARLFTAVFGFLGVFQASLSYAFNFFPTLDQAIPFLQAIPHMIPIHSTLHFVTSIVALVIFYRGGERGAFWFAFGFGLFYTSLGVAGMITGHQYGLGLKPFDHPFHIFIGALALLAAAPTIYHSFSSRRVAS